MTNKTKFLKFGIAVIIGTSAAGMLYAQLSIPTNIDNAVMTIKQINITTEGKATTPKVVIDGSAGDDNFLKVEGSILMGTITGSSNQINKVAGDKSSILGGGANDVNGNNSVIAGGRLNKVIGNASTNIGGIQNNINGDSNTILGGYSNAVTGTYSTIAGGQGNNVNANNSLAAGKNTQVNTQGTFAWSDNYAYPLSQSIFSSLRDYTFLIRARNGVGINTGNTTTGYALTMQGSGIVYGNMVSNGYYYKTISAEDDQYELTLSQWQDSVNTGDIYYNSGYVGIGVSTPTALLHTNGAVRFQGLGSLTERTALMIDSDGNISTRLLGDAAFPSYVAPVTSVAGRSGDVVLSKSDVGLSNVDNTTDLNKPISTATQTALDLKANLASPALTGIPTSPTPALGANDTQIATTAFIKGQGYLTISDIPVTSVAGKVGAVTLVQADVGLGNVDNTSDMNKPISTATQTALDLKAPLLNPALTGIPTAPTAPLLANDTQIATTAFVKGQGYLTVAPVTSVAGKVGAVALVKADVGLGNVDNTTDMNKPISTATQAALNTKAPLISPAFTGIPTAPTPALSSNDTTVATTAFIKGQGYLLPSDLATKMPKKVCDFWFSADRSTNGMTRIGKWQNGFRSDIYDDTSNSPAISSIASQEFGNGNRIENGCYGKNLIMCFPTGEGSSYGLKGGYVGTVVEQRVLTNSSGTPTYVLFWGMSPEQWDNETDLGLISEIQYASRITAMVSCIYQD